MKKMILGLTIISMLVACGGEKKAETEVTGETKKIVLITMDSLDEHWLSVKDGAEAKASELGGAVEIIFRAPAGKTDPNEQTRMVEDAINQEADAIILAPSDGAALTPVSKRVIEAGIPLILIDSPLQEDVHNTFLSTDNEAAGALAADNLAKLINNKGKIAVVHAQAASSSAIARGKGFVDRMTEIAPDVVIVSTQYSDGDKARALNIATDIMTANPDLVGFFTSNEGSTVGVARALEELSLKDTVMLVGFDKSQDTIRALENGTLKATMVQNPDKMGSQGVEYAVALIEGKTDVPKDVDTGVTVVTLENIDLIK